MSDKKLFDPDWARTDAQKLEIEKEISKELREVIADQEKEIERLNKFLIVDERTLTAYRHALTRMKGFAVAISQPAIEESVKIIEQRVAQLQASPDVVEVGRVYKLNTAAGDREIIIKDAMRPPEAGDEIKPERYAKKPVTVDAFRAGHDHIPDWFMEKVTSNDIVLHTYRNLDWCFIKTLEGAMAANYGDWIIKGIKGEIYPCKPDIFEATYTRTQPEAQGIEKIEDKK